MNKDLNLKIDELKKVTIFFGTRSVRQEYLKHFYPSETIYIIMNKFNVAFVEKERLKGKKVIVINDIITNWNSVEKLNFIKFLFEFIEDNDFKIILGTFDRDMITILQNMIINFKLKNNYECYRLKWEDYE